jgi:hypothetical protein
MTPTAGSIRACEHGSADMPLTAKGKKIKKAMEKTYGKERGDRVFYAAENKGSIKGIAKKGKTK